MISYKKLRHLLVERHLTNNYLHTVVGLTWPTISKINKDKYVSLVLCLFICIKNKNWKVKLVTGILTFLGILLLYASIKIKYLIGI